MSRLKKLLDEKHELERELDEITIRQDELEKESGELRIKLEDVKEKIKKYK